LWNYDNDDVRRLPISDCGSTDVTMIGKAVLEKDGGTTHTEIIMKSGAHAIHYYFHPLLHLPCFPFAYFA
jgi:hypothetical protein